MPNVLSDNSNSPGPSEREGPWPVSTSDALRSHVAEETLGGPVRERTTSFDAAHTNVVELLLDSATGFCTNTWQFGRIARQDFPDYTLHHHCDGLGRNYTTLRASSANRGAMGHTVGYTGHGLSGDADYEMAGYKGSSSSYLWTDYARDAHGRVVATTNDIGGVSTRAYDAMGRLVGRGGSADFPAQSAYDSLGRHISLSTTRNGSLWDTTTWAYDPETGLATAKTYADDSVVSYTHTADGLPLRTTWARGAWRESGYDAARREVARHYSDPSLDCAFERDVFGAIVAASNAVADIAILRNDPGMVTKTLAFSYALDNLLRPTGRNADTFGYDARSQVTSATLRASETNAYTYAYDNAGNRSAAAEAGVSTSYTANELNQYSAISGDLPAYDADGNLLTNGVWSYAWDAENRLAAVYNEGSCVVSNAYDAFSRRVLKVTPTETHTFLYDGWNVVREEVRDNSTGFVTETCDYYWGRDLSGSLQGVGGVGGLLAYTRNGALRIPVYDHIGNVVAVINESGAIVAAYEYDPFGNIVAQSGAEADEVPFRFSTKYWDAEAGLYYYGYRFYSPELGRWINRDPIEEKGGGNLYTFCQNNGISQLDRLGRNIYLVEGNDTGYAINDRYHQSVCVDDESSLDNANKKTCFSFGLVGVGCFVPKRTWLGWYESTLGGLLMKGEVYETTFIGNIRKTKVTTKAQDEHWLAWMRSARKGLTDVYSVARHNCRRYSQNEFHDAPGVVP